MKLVPEVLYYFMFPQHYVGVPVLPHPCLTLDIVRFFIIIILVSLKWYLVVLICISPMTNDVEDLICCSYFFVKCPNLLPIKKIGFFISELREFSVYPQVLYQIHDLQVFSPTQ